MMKRRVAVLAVGVLALPLLWALAVPKDRQDQWKKVDEAMSKGLPRTAISHLEPIIAAAMKDKAYPEAIKALCKKITLEGNIQGNRPEEKIVRLKAALAQAPAEMKPVLETVLATWHWHYFQHNRWRILNRTATADRPGDDIQAWDLRRIFAEIEHRFNQAFTHEKYLKSVPISDYDDLVEKGTVPDRYRPTLYDLLAAQALAFYQSGEQAGARPQDAFDLSAAGPIFAPASDFMAWKVETTDEGSVVVKAIKLYQQLLTFHKDDADRSAFLDADLGRLNIGYNKAVGETKNARYKEALKNFSETNKGHETYAHAMFLWASVAQAEGDLVEARRLADLGEKAYPNSHGGVLCHNLIAQIDARSSAVATERVWNDPLPTIDVRYRNITKVYLRAVKDDYEARLKIGSWQPEYLDRTAQKALLQKQPAKAWTAELPATADYRERVERLPAPQGLQPGFYYLIASQNEDFGENNNVVTYAPFWVSDLALVVRSRYSDGRIEGLVTQAQGGAPLANAKVNLWAFRWNTPGYKPLSSTTSDAKGLFAFDNLDGNHNYALLLKHKDQELSSAHALSAHRYDTTPRPHQQTVFFTDRSLYRPGQTVHYSALVVDLDPTRDNYKALANHKVTVVFQDPNHKEVARKELVTNEYGSASGTFTAPSDRLRGRFTIRVDGAAQGQTNFNVEEYKRPKFQVALEKPKVSARLNGPVTVEGKATAYTGAAVDGAKVRYRVVRQVQYPEWWGWYYWWRQPRTDAQEIAHGEAVTAADGTFKVEFKALPDLRVLEKDEPVFSYTVSADVTDNAGETRSNTTSVRVGYTALQAKLSASHWLTSGEEAEVAVLTTTLDGEPQAAACTVKVYKLKQPAKVHRARLNDPYSYRAWRGGKEEKPEPDLSNPNSWELGEVAVERDVKTDDKGQAKLGLRLGVGAYRALVQTQDRFGKKVTAVLPLQVIDPKAGKLAIKVPFLINAPKWKLEPGEKFTLVWGSGYEDARAYVEVEHKGKVAQAFWTEAGQTQATLEQEVTEAMRGGFTVRVSMVRENRAYLESRHVDVPWTNKELTVRWERFLSKLEPGQKTTWTAVVSGPKAQKAVAEMVAALYDESLDQFLPHGWQDLRHLFRTDWSNLTSQLHNHIAQLQYLHGHVPTNTKYKEWTYRQFPNDIIGNFWGYAWFDGGRNRGRFSGPGGGGMLGGAPAAPMASLATRREAANGEAKQDAKKAFAESDKPAEAPPAAPGEQGRAAAATVTPRKNLNETAFFFPQLVSNEEGEVRMEFTMPEALTKWKFLGLTHDKELRSGLLTGSAVTARDLMVQPHPPRYLREGDELEFTVKVTNQSAAAQKGTVRLTFSDARTLKSVDAALSNEANEKAFEVPAKESRSYSFRIKVPDDLGFVVYKATGSTGEMSDGEEGYLPVLTKRVLVTESLPLPLRNAGEKTWHFKRLEESGKSDTLKTQSYTVQMVSNPNWYAVMALPYLMEYPYQCSEQVFNRLYANALGQHIANSDPKIKRVFKLWEGTAALDSPLTKNSELKEVMLEETPWLRQANRESEARRNVALFFDDNRLAAELARAQQQLAQTQYPDGAFPWFPGGPPNDYITLYIATGYGRLRHLGVKTDVGPALRALGRMDGWIDRIYQEIVRHGRLDQNNLTPTIALYLYGRSFFLKDQQVGPEHKKAVDYFLAQAKEYWLKLANRQSQGHLAVALNRWGDRKTSVDILKSVKERSVSSEEMGMYWRDLELSWWWFRAPIETQALMIEAFDEVMKDTAAVDDMKVWLLKQKQTQDWKTTKATADAVYALLLRGESPLASDALVEVKLGGEAVKPEKVEAGTGFFEKRFVRGEVKPEMGEIVTRKTDKGVSWGSVTWQYLEDVDKVTAYEGTPLTLKKALYKKVHTKKGPLLEPIKGAVKVGDEVVVRLELRTDRDMEYVHLKDARGTGLEPVNVLSRYKYQDGLAYYETTRDTASHFFIDYLPKGTYVFEYSTRVAHRGSYSCGMASIQCMYAPEFNSHSASFVVRAE